MTNRKWCFRVWLLAKTGSNQKSKILLESRKCAFRLKLLSFCKVENCIACSSPIESSLFAYGLSQKQAPTKSRKSYLKVESVRFAWSFCNSAESSMRWRFTKWRFHFFMHCTLRLLSFCKVEHTMALQKVVFPFCWALHAVVWSGGCETGRPEWYTYDGRHELEREVCTYAGKPRMIETSGETYTSGGQKFRSFSRMCKNCGRTWRKPKTEVVRWGLEHSWYGGLDYPCRGLYIFPHGYDFEVRWIRFLFPLAMGGVDFGDV